MEKKEQVTPILFPIKPDLLLEQLRVIIREEMKMTREESKGVGLDKNLLHRRDIAKYWIFHWLHCTSV